MKTDEAIKQVGFEALNKTLGLVDTERFIALINREKFDYTQWRKTLFSNMTLSELADKADKYSSEIDS